jgi:hypothetical protein
MKLEPLEVQEILELHFAYIIGQKVRVRDDAELSPVFEWARGIRLKIKGYMAQGDESGDDLFYTCVPDGENTAYNVAYLREEVLRPVKMKEKVNAPAKAA